MEDQYKCAAGTYCDGNRAVSTSTGGAQCSIGKYCPEGTEHELDCPVGTVGLTAGLESIVNCSPCQPG